MMSFDTTDLIEIKFQKVNKNYDTQGSYYIDPHTGECVAKTCSMCAGILTSTSFKKNKGKKYGLRSSCKACEGARPQKKATRVNPPGVDAERMRTSMAERRTRTPEQILRDRKERHPDGMKVCRTCRESISIYEYYSDRGTGDGLRQVCKICDKLGNKERKAKKLRSRWADVGVPFDSCFYCNSTIGIIVGDTHGDHVVPQVLEGSDEIHNIAPSCASCNICKRDTPVLQFLAEAFYSHEERGAAVGRLIQYGYLTESAFPKLLLDTTTPLP